MKTFLKFTALTAFLLMLAGVAVSCNDRDETPIAVEVEDPKDPKDPEDPDFEYPIEIPFTEFSLVGTSCDWINFTHDNRVIIVNSREELESHIDCLSESFPDIDFSEYSLLIVAGLTSGAMPPCATPTRFSQRSIKRYTLEITVSVTIASVMGPWTSFILVPKLSDNVQVTLETLRITYFPCL